MQDPDLAFYGNLWHFGIFAKESDRKLDSINFISIWRELLVSLSLERVELSTSLKE